MNGAAMTTFWNILERVLGTAPVAVVLEPPDDEQREGGRYEPPVPFVRVPLTGDAEDADRIAAEVAGRASALVVMLARPRRGPGQVVPLVEAALRALAPDGKLGLLVGSGVLASQQGRELRALLLERGGVDWIVWPGRVGNEYLGLHDTFNLALIVVSPSREPRPVRLVDLADDSADAAMALVKAAASRAGGEVGRTIVRREPLPPDVSWTWTRLSKAYDELQRDTEELGEMVPLQTFVAWVGRGVRPTSKLADYDDRARGERMVPVFEGRSVARNGDLTPARFCISAADLHDDVLLRSGDLLLTEVRRPGEPLRAAEIAPSDLPAAAGSSVLVIRLVEGMTRVERDLLKAFIRTARFAKSLDAGPLQLHLSVDALLAAHVPRFSPPLLEAIDRLGVAEATLSALAASIREQRLRFVEAPRFREALPALLVSSRDAYDRSEAARDAVSLNTRIRKGFPHPLAVRRERVVLMEPNKERLTLTLECAEHLIMFAGFLGLLNENPADINWTKPLVTGQGGLTLDWGKSYDLLRQCAAKAAKAPDPAALAVPELASLHEHFVDTGSELSGACAEMAIWRNGGAHLHRLTEEQVAAVSTKCIDHLDVLFEACSFLTDTPLVFVEDYARDPLTGVRRAKFAHVVGISPAFRSESKTVDGEISRGDTGVQDTSGRFHSLSPWLMRRTCAACGHAETFVMNKADGRQATFVAMETGHPLVDDPQAVRFAGHDGGKPTKVTGSQ